VGKTNKGLENYREGRKTETVNMVRRAIDDLIAEGFIVDRDLICERTGLSNSVLSKDHCQAVFKEKKVCGYEVKRKLSVPKSRDNDVELKKAYEDIAKLEKKVKLLEEQLNKHKVKYYELKEDNEVLRGKFHLLMQKAKIRGIDLDEK
jgi:hypothetical protein